MLTSTCKLCIAILAVLVAACVTGRERQQGTDTDSHSDVATPLDQQSTPIDSIILIRRAGLGPGPNYIAILTADGRAEYRGGRSMMSLHILLSFTGRQGVYEGQINPRTYGTLVRAVRELGLLERPPPYPPAVDAQEMIVVLVARGGRVTHRSIMEDRAAIWLVAEAIDGILEKIVWHEVQGR